MQHSEKIPPNPLLKKARKKYVAINRARELLDYNPNSKLKNGYKNTFFCSHNIVVEDGKIKSGGYCKNRWCAVCAPIRMATLINKYESGWKQLVDPYFVTLTDKTVKGKALKKTIEKRAKIMQQIKEKARKKKLKRFDGTRKLEVTIRPNNLYHAHYHYIISGKENADFLIKQWLKYCPTAKRQAQDMRPVTNTEQFLEMAKYETKNIVDDRRKDGKRERQCPKRLDLVYRALHKKRTFQPFGAMMKYSKKENEDETFDEKELEAKETEKDLGVYTYNVAHFDWFNIETGESLTNFKATENIKGLFGYKYFQNINKRWQVRDISKVQNMRELDSFDFSRLSYANLSREEDDEKEKNPDNNSRWTDENQIPPDDRFIFEGIHPSKSFGTSNSPPEPQTQLQLFHYKE